jgi:hypothetical protein
MEYNYPEHFSKNAEAAVKLAQELKLTGEYDFFRGQKSTYDIQPSVSRIGVDKNAAAVKLAEFAYWVNNTPELSSLHGNYNAILAVAQHYGLKTPLLDFSHSPEIAGFFATDGGETDEMGTIICINKKRFQESWSDINDNYYEKNGMYLTEIIEIDVKNLWRLQAQQGLFLKCHVDSSLLEMFSCFLHIYFPQKNRITIIDQEKVYPKAKSHLEVLLRQYFLIDSYPKREKQLAEIFELTIASGGENDIRKEMEAFFIMNSLPAIHKSWRSDFANSWLNEPDEKYSNAKTVVDICISLPQNLFNIREFEINLFKQIEREFIKNDFLYSNRKSVNWIVKSYKGVILYIDSEGFTDELNDFTDFTASQMVDSIYSGMRNLPYSNYHVVKAISRYLTIVQFGIYEVIEDAVGIVFSGGSVRGRGFCSSKKIYTALRDDFFNLINPRNLNSLGKLEFRDTLFCARYVNTSYVFERFIDLFVEDVIPTIAAVAVEGLIIVVNPMRIELLGES